MYPVSWLMVTVAPGSGPAESVTLTVMPPDCANAADIPNATTSVARTVGITFMTSSRGPFVQRPPSPPVVVAPTPARDRKKAYSRPISGAGYVPPAPTIVNLATPLF
jgi:hypothetical protein